MSLAGAVLVAGLLHGPLARRAGGDPADVHPAGVMFDEYQDIDALQQHGVHVQEVDREDPGCLGVQEQRRAGPVRRDAGSMPAACRICHTVDGATVTPSSASSPWIRRYPTADSPSPGTHVPLQNSAHRL